MDHASPSLRGRIALAVALTAAFYLLALGIAAALIAGPILVAVLAEAMNLWVFAACELAGFTILWAIVPRRLPFEPGGPQLTREAQPELHAFLDDVAAQVGDRPVDEVYLAADVNASVAEVGRPRRRVLHLGLPLLQVLDVEELRAVLAHEHAHYAGGDTRVGPWIWRTQATIGRTIGRLEDGGWLRRAIAKVFHAYGKLFLRITAAVSRREEHAADAHAARVAGPAAHRRALLSIRRAALAFDPYLDDDANPALNAGVHPPIAEGFARFLAVPEIRASLDRAMEAQVTDDEGSPYDTHPTLPARLAAIGAPADGAEQPESDAPLAATLLRDLPVLEEGLMVGEGDLEQVAWEDVGTEATLPTLRRNVGADAFVLGEHRIADAGRLAREPRKVYDVLFRDDPPSGPEEHAAARDTAISLLCGAIAVALGERGWQLHRLPGEPLRLTRGDDELVPSARLGAIHDGEAEPADWEAECERLGIGALSLVPPSEEALAAERAEGADGATSDAQSLAGTGR